MIIPPNESAPLTRSYPILIASTQQLSFLSEVVVPKKTFLESRRFTVGICRKVVAIHGLDSDGK